MPSDTSGHWTRAVALAEVLPGKPYALKLKGHLIALFRNREAGTLVAVDNRCPHMGFPMTKGTLQDGVLTCHWHQWQFDACSGGCLSPGSRGTDLTTYPVEERSGEIWVELPAPAGSEAMARHRQSLDRAVFEASTLRAGKAIYSLLEGGAGAAEICRIAAARALPLREEAGTGPLTLAAVASVLELTALPIQDRTLALTHAVRTTALEIRATAVRRSEVPLPGKTGAGRDKAWIRGFLEDREVSAAERVLVTAIRRGAAASDIANLIFAPVTDHVFNNLGHTLDFCRKSFELLDRIGWEHAETVLPPLLPLIANGIRHEEDMAWKRPEDLIALIREGEKTLPAKDNPAGRWQGGNSLVESLLGEDAKAALRGISKALADGASYAEIGKALALAASLRVARFHPLNEFGDWDTVHHAFTHSHALYRALEAHPSRELARGLFHAAGYLYLARYLNVPKVHLPHEGSRPAPACTLAEAVERRDVDAAAAIVWEGLKRDPSGKAVLAELASAAFREDLGFHTIQHLEASIRLFGSLEGHPLRYVPLAGLARWMAAHGPTPRAVRQTVTNAIKLQRGEALHEEAS